MFASSIGNNKWQISAVKYRTVKTTSRYKLDTSFEAVMALTFGSRTLEFAPLKFNWSLKQTQTQYIKHGLCCKQYVTENE